jgi:porin
MVFRFEREAYPMWLKRGLVGVLLSALLAAPSLAGAPTSEQSSEPRTSDAALAIPPGDPRPPTGVEEELDLITPGVMLKREFDRIAEKTNVRVGLAYTLLVQQATGGPGDRNAAGGDVDLLAKWTALGAGTKDTGILVFAGEYRHQIGDQPPSELGGDIGTLLPTTNGFSERPPVVKELYWDQRLFDDRFRFGFGRIDPENLFGGHRLQSANLYFLDKAFSSNPTVSYPGSGLAAAALVKPLPWLYIDGGISDANGRTTVNDFEEFFHEREFLSFAEAGLIPTIQGLGAGRYRVAYWHIDSKDDTGAPSDQGVTISVDQELGKRLTVFARYGYSDADVTGIRNSVQGGVALKNLLLKDDLFGVAAAWSQPLADSKREEKVIEAFERVQITETLQLTFDAEMIIDPGNNSRDDVVGVFSARLRFSF